MELSSKLRRERKEMLGYLIRIGTEVCSEMVGVRIRKQENECKMKSFVSMETNSLTERDRKEKIEYEGRKEVLV